MKNKTQTHQCANGMKKCLLCREIDPDNYIKCFMIISKTKTPGEIEPKLLAH